jgi:hypothetical protein
MLREKADAVVAQIPKCSPIYSYLVDSVMITPLTGLSWDSWEPP